MTIFGTSQVILGLFFSISKSRNPPNPGISGLKCGGIPEIGIAFAMPSHRSFLFKVWPCCSDTRRDRYQVGDNHKKPLPVNAQTGLPSAYLSSPTQ